MAVVGPPGLLDRRPWAVTSECSEGVPEGL